MSRKPLSEILGSSSINNEQKAPQAQAQARKPLSEIVSSSPAKEPSLLSKVGGKIKETASEVGGFAKKSLGSIIDTGKDFVQDIKEKDFSTTKSTISGTLKELRRAGTAFGAGVVDTAKITIPKSIGTLGQMIVENTDIGFGIGLPNGANYMYEPQFIKNAKKKTIDFLQLANDGYNAMQEERMTELGITSESSIFDPANFGYQFSSGVSSLGVAVAVTVATRNPMVAGVALGWLEGSDTYQKSKDKLKEEHPEWDEDKVNRTAMSLAMVDTAGIALLEKVGLDFLFRSYGKGALYKMAMGAITETIQESSQTVWSNLVAKFGYDKSVNVLDDVIETMIVTMPIGFFGAGALGQTDIPAKVIENVAKSAGVDKKEAQEIIEAVKPAIEKEVAKVPQTLDFVENRPSNQEIADRVAQGESKNAIALELSEKITPKEAVKVVEEALADKTVKTETVKPVAPKSKFQEQLAKFRAIDDQVLTKTPADIQTEFDTLSSEFNTNIEALKQDVADIKQKVSEAKDGSKEKQTLKQELSQAKEKVAKAEQTFQNILVEQASSMRTFVSDFVKKTYKGFTEAQRLQVVDKVTEQLTGENLPSVNLRQVILNTAKTIKGVDVNQLQAGAEALKAQLKLQPDNVAVKNALAQLEKKIAKANEQTKPEKATKKVAKAKKTAKTKETTTNKVKSTKKTQKEIVKEVVAKKEKATIKEIAQETGILEPNVRRILGVGAKDGVFERVAEGVYKITNKQGEEVAVIIPADAVKTLPKLASEGFKADMVFLDIPYDTPAVKGGNRGVKYSFVSVEDFGVILDAVKEIARTEYSPIIHMYSQAPSGLKAMAKYNDLFTEKGFVAIGKGEYQKTFKDGSPVTSPNGKVAQPEGIIVFNKSGNIEKELDLNFKMVRPKGYQTEKPAEMLKAMIEMTTNEGDVVLDPFAGSGVTGAEAVKAGRKAVLLEKNKEVAEKITKPRVEVAVAETKQVDGVSANTSVTFELLENNGKWRTTFTEYKGRPTANMVYSFLSKAQKKEYDSIRDRELDGTKADAEKQLSDLATFEANNKEAFEKANKAIDAIETEETIDETNKNEYATTPDKTFYHGTLAVFDKFDEKRVGENTEYDNAKWGFFFIDDKARAEKFVEDTRPTADDRPANILEVKLNIKNPLDLTIKGVVTKADQASLIYEIMTGEKLSSEEALEILDADMDLGSVSEFYDELYSNIENKKKIQEAGYDGIVSEFGRDGKDIILEYVAFNSDQIEIIVDKTTDKGENKDNDRNTKSTTNTRGVSKTTRNSTGEPRGAGTDTKKSGTSVRGKSDGLLERGDKSGERSTARLTNEQVLEEISKVTEIQDGEVLLKGEVTEEMLEIAGQYAPEGKTKSGRGILDEYYTNSQVVDMVKSLFNFPAKGLKVLEPAVGTGNFLYALPEIGNHEVIGIEPNETTARIAKIFHNDAKIKVGQFEQIFIDERGNKLEYKSDYDLVIGNPPYGEHRGKYKGLGEEKNIAKYETYFIKRGIQLLKEGGKLAMVVPSSFLRSSSSDTKIEIATLGNLVTAFRLPNGIFAGTDIGTDLVIFEKRDPKKDLTDVVSIVDDGFFKAHPENILGTVTKKKNRFGKMDEYIAGTLDDAIALFYEQNNAQEAIELLNELKVETTDENVETTETAIEEAGSKEKAKRLVTEAQKKGKKTIEKKIKKETVKTGEIVSLMEQFQNEFTTEEINAWKDTNPDGSLNNPEDHKDVANYSDGKWYLDFNYAQGDIYEKMEQLEKDKSKIDSKQYAKQLALLEKVLPTKESIDDLKLSPNIGFVKNTLLNRTEEVYVMGENKQEQMSLKSAFLKWIQDLPREAFGGSNSYEVREYVNNEQVRGSDKDRNERVRIRRKQSADNLFQKFLKEGLSAEEKVFVENEYNKTFNFYHTPDYTKVPMFSEVYTTFKGRPFDLRPVQKHGIGRLMNTGVGLLAHDVGFGKTISGVLALSEALHRGWAKKPIVVTPSENVYKQWIDTIQELVPNTKLNLLGNLGGSFKGDLSSLNIEDGSITLLTYEGFKRLGFSDNTYKDLSSKFKYIADDLDKHKSERDKEKSKAKAQEFGGAMKKGTRADLSFEDLGFDHITFDEVHNANHIVSKVKLEKGQASEFNRFSLRPSDLGIKTWLATQYIQQKNNGRNVNLLSATPFTNHPLEYYSILSLMADKSLAKMGLLNVNDFFGTFMEAENEYEFKADGTYQKKTDIRSFRNFRQFRKLLDTYIDFKEGQAEGIKRPDRVQQTYEIPQNELGIQMEQKAQEIFQEDDKQAGQGAKVLRAIGELRKIAFSPYASKFSEDLSPSEYKKFVEGSPKIKTLMGLIAQNKQDKPNAGQIVYVDQVGVDFLPMMKDYLVKELGFAKEEVEIISGAVSKTKRFEIQNDYNSGKVKVLLGSEAIKEGMNLQENTSDLYIMSLPWNFTQLRQVIGRAWRQGNKWKNVRINNLFIQDSIDIFLSQKLENKQKRYENAIKSGDNEVDVGDVSFNEMKFDLIRDPQTRAKLELQAEKERLSQELTQETAELAFATRKLDKINDLMKTIKSDKESLQQERESQKKAIEAGEEADNYWIDRYTNEVIKSTQILNEEIQRLRDKGVDVDSLTNTKNAGEKKIEELEKKIKSLDETFNDRVAEIAKSLPERKPFSDDTVKAFVAERASQNQDFYILASDTAEKIITPEVETKEIMNASKTKVVKKVVKKKAVKSQKVKKVVGKQDEFMKVLTDPKLTAQQKVDSLLEKRQEGKKFKDVGERVSGSKKEKAMISAVIEYGDNDVLRSLAHELGNDAILQELSKNKIFENLEVPTRDLEIKKKTPAFVANFKVNVFNRMAQVPSLMIRKGKYNTYTVVNHRIMDEFIVRYPEALKKFVADLNAVSSVESAEAIEDKYRYHLFEFEHNGEVEKISSEVLGKDFRNILDIKNVSVSGKFVKGTYNALSTHIKEAQDNLLAIENQGIVEEYSDYYKKMKYKAMSFEYGEYGYRNTSFFRDTFEEARQDFKEALKEKGMTEKDVFAKEKKTAEDLIKDANTNYDKYLPTKEAGKTKQIKDAEASLERTKKNVEYYENMIKEMIEDSPAEKERYEKYLQNAKEDLKAKQDYLNRLSGKDVAYVHGNFEVIDEYDVKDVRFKKDFIKAENLMKVYGFKSAQFGNYMDDQSAKQHIVQTMASMEDMSKITGVDMAKIANSLGLSVAFGARGGGRANAHFEPTKNIINLTKSRGDGSFGHEFMHFLDYQVGKSTHRGKWSAGKGYGRYSYSGFIDRETMLLNRAFFHGVDIDVDKTFKPQDDVSIEDIEETIVKWKKEGKTLDEAVARVPEIYSDYNSRREDVYQSIANLYRKEITVKVKQKSREYYNNSLKYAGYKENSYWVRTEELWARAFQAYLEDKMEEKGIKNNYLTRSTKDIPIYPQGAERKAYNEMFDKLFYRIAEKYPITDTQETRFKTTETGRGSLNEAQEYLNDLKNRLKIDFDVHFVNSILVDKKINIFTKQETGRVEAYGAQVDNTIAIVKDMARHTAEHETVHLTLSNLDKISAFKGISRDQLMTVQARRMGIEWNEKTDRRIEEQLAIGFENFVEQTAKPTGILEKFYIILKRLLTKFAEAIKLTKGDVIRDYYEILSEGESVDTEMVRLENKGIMEAFIEDGELNVDKMEVLLSNKIKPMDSVKANGILKALQDSEDQHQRFEILNSMSEAEVQQFAVSSAGNIAFELFEQTFADVLDRVREDFKFQIKKDGDKRLEDLKSQFNELADKLEKIEANTVAWKQDIEQNIIKASEKAELVDEVGQKVKDLARYTKRTEPVGTITATGEQVVEKLEFESLEQAQEEVHDYLKRKTELVETRNQLRTLRKDIASARKEGKANQSALRDVERRLRRRKEFLEKRDYYVGMGLNRGKKEQMKMIRRRGRVLSSTQDFFGISDAKKKDIIAGRHIHLMDEFEFNDFLIEFANKAQALRNTLDARDEVRALLQEKQLQKTDNLRKAMQLPPIDKMTQEQANRFVEVLSTYSFGDVFLTKRELETVHRTNWGEIKTERELLAKFPEQMGFAGDELKTLTAPSEKGLYTPWIKLARSHPFFNWLTGKRIEATIKAEREIHNVEMDLNPLVAKARRSRRQKMGLKGKVADILIPTDKLVFDYIEAQNKEAFAKKNGLTEEELTLAEYLIKMYQGAYEYLKSEYGVRERQNYMTHIRRSFWEALKEGGIKEAMSEVFKSQKETEASLKILDEQTGEILAFEKWFGFAMQRSGQLVPSKNVSKASLAYFKAFAKKKALDQFVPEAMVAVQAHKALVGTTDKGLTKDPTLQKFVERYLNDAKGRKVWFVTTQGSNKDIALRAFTTWIVIKYLGLNIASAVANFVGDFVAIFWELSLKEAGKGAIRSLAFKKAYNLNKEFRFFTGRNPIAELFDPQYAVPEQILKGVMVLMSLASFQSSKFFLRAKMTDAEWTSGVIGDARLTEIAKSLSRAKPNKFYVKSLAGNTTAGGATFQFGTWAVAIFNTFTSDVQEVIKMLRAKKGWDAVTSKEAQKVSKFVIMATVLAMIASFISVDDDDDSEWAKIMRKAQRELTTLTQALQFVTDPANYAMILDEISKVIIAIGYTVSREKYQTDGVGYKIGDSKASQAWYRIVTPNLLKQFFPQERESAKDSFIEEAIKNNDFSKESALELVELINADEISKREGDEKTEYIDKKIAELTALYNFKSKYPDSKVGEIITSNLKNDEKIQKMVELSQEVGVETVYGELKNLYADRTLCSDPKKKTGCIVSAPLLKEFQLARRKLLK